MKRVLFFVRKFPVLSETFVLDQILALERTPDLQVRVVSLTRPEKPVVHEQVRQSPACREPIVLLETGMDAREKRTAQVGYILRHPVWFLSNLADPQVRDRYIPLLCSRIATPLEADEIIAHFGDVGVLADKLRHAGRLKGHLNVFFAGYDMSRREVWERYRDEYRRLAFSGCRLLPVSEFLKRRLLDLGCPPGSVRVHRLGVDLERFVFRPQRPMRRPPVLFSAARLVEKKGIDTAVRAVGILSERGMNVRYRVAGIGPLLPELLALRDRLDLQEHVEFLGAVPTEQVAEELAAADVSMLPSQTASDGDMEGIPVSLVEAMAAGVPVVSTFHSGIPELIENGVSGFLVSERDHVALADCLQRCLGMTTEQLEPIRRAARKRVETEFNAEVWNSKLPGN
ncbi:MAG: glycosyltransferase [Chloroflexota bacterium]